LNLGRAGVFVANELALVRTGLRPDSSAFRHAVRLAVAVPASELIARALHLPRPYWVPFTVVVVLKADYSTLFRRGLGRVIGTVAGATFAALIVGGLHPGEIASVAFVGGVAWASYSLWQSNFALSTAFTTALILVLLSATQVDTLSTALDRLIDTVLGGAIALGVYVVWPTWSTAGARASLAVLGRAIAAYLLGTVALVGGDVEIQGEISGLARSARVAWGQAEAAVGRSLDEPKQHRIDAEFANGALAASRRVIQALHSLRLEAQRGVTVEPFEALHALAHVFAERLDLVARVLDGDADPEGLGPSRALRQEFAPVAATLERNEAPRAIALQLDEIVDAINTLSGVVASGGVRSVDDDHLHLRWSR
jgi:uncharacterized membrane protein YccC